jgi:hypothetical protein
MFAKHDVLNRYVWLLSRLLCVTLIVQGLLTVRGYAQGTSFTYQGRLQDGGGPANGNYDFQFTLWDALIGGTIQPQPMPVIVTKPNVPVSGGVFTVQLDFSANAFPGADRFLEISVRPAGGNNFTTLPPRQQISSTPYAVRSLSAASADGLSSACANCVTSGQIVAGAVTASLIAPGAIVDSNISAAAGIAPTKIAGTAATLGANVFGATQTISAGNLALPATAGSSTGVLTMGGTPFMHGFTPAGAFAPNTFIGGNAGNFTMTGSGLNTGVGYNVLTSDTNGCCNSAFGTYALLNNTTGFDNTAIGYPSLEFNTTGTRNTATGAFSLTNNSSGFYNTVDGVGAMFANTIGNYNTASGGEVLHDNTSGCCNAVTGYYAMHANTTGSNNIAVGNQAGYTTVPANANTTGSDNTFLGGLAGPGTTTQLINATAIGSYAVVSQSNSMVLGRINQINGAGSSTNVGIGTTTPGYKLHIAGHTDSDWPIIKLENLDVGGHSYWFYSGANGKTADLGIYDETALAYRLTFQGSTLNVGINNVNPSDVLDVMGDIRVGSVNGCVKDRNGSVIAGTCASDARFKSSITPFPKLLDRLVQLQPVHFYWRTEEFPERHFGTSQSFGLVAQDVEKVMPELVVQDQEGYKAVHYEQLPVLMLQAIKELNENNDSLQQENKRLNDRLDALTKLVCMDHPHADACREIKP